MIKDSFGVEYYDYSHDVRFISKDQYFNDADHLSDMGAKYFTAIVFDEVLDIQID